jgi:hypothetical protein
LQYKLFITYMEFIIILFLLVLNGVFAMYEIALVSSSKARLETLAGKGNKRAKGVLKQLEEPEKFLSTIQIGHAHRYCIRCLRWCSHCRQCSTIIRLHSRGRPLCKRPGHDYNSGNHYVPFTHHW